MLDEAWVRARSDKSRGRQLYEKGSQCGGCAFYDWLYNDSDYGLCVNFNRIMFEHDNCTEWRPHPWGWDRPCQRPMLHNGSELDAYTPEYLSEYTDTKPAEPINGKYWWED